MFKIYDLNYKEVSFPVDDLGFGLKSLDIDIGPVIYENIYTQSSRADQLVKRYPKDRTVTLHAMFTSYNKNVADWRLKRDRVYEYFRTLGVFYVAESYQPFKLLKVIVDADYMPDRPVNIWGMLDIPLKIIDTPFKQSLHTTLDIDSEGVRWNDKWGYGMGLSSDKSEWKYSFDTDAGQSYNFKFLNAGTEEVKLIQQKDSRIRVEFKVSGSWFEISDGSTTFRLNKSYVNGDVLVIRGSKVFFNGQNVLQDTNHNFLTVKKGMNTWQTRGPKYYDFEIDFRFLYD